MKFELEFEFPLKMYLYMEGFKFSRRWKIWLGVVVVEVEIYKCMWKWKRSVGLTHP
jgi:hypothetical protein